MRQREIERKREKGGEMESDRQTERERVGGCASGLLGYINTLFCDISNEKQTHFHN